MRAPLLLIAIGACTPDPVPVSGEPWNSGTDLPGRRLEAAVTALGSRLVVLGGFSTAAREGLEVTREVLAYDTLTETWSNLPDAPVAWTHAGLVGANGSLYLFGGLEGADFVPRGDCFVLGPDDDAWRPVAPMPAGQARGAAAIVAAPPQILVIGGATTGGAAVGNILTYDIVHDRWAELRTLPFPRSHPAAMRTPDGTLIVAGGIATDGHALADTWALRLRAADWEARSTMLEPHGGCAYGVIQGQLACAGGEAGSAALASVELYEPYRDEWTAGPAMPAPRAGARGAAIGQELYVPGGAAALVFEPLTSLLVFTPLDTTPEN